MAAMAATPKRARPRRTGADRRVLGRARPSKAPSGRWRTISSPSTISAPVPATRAAVAANLLETPPPPDRRGGRADRGVRAVTAATLKGGVHRAWRHDSAEKHVTGRAVYIDDMPAVPGTQEIWLATSPHPHACILSIDCAAARAVPGGERRRHRRRHTGGQRRRPDLLGRADPGRTRRRICRPPGRSRRRLGPRHRAAGGGAGRGRVRAAGADPHHRGGAGARELRRETAGHEARRRGRRHRRRAAPDRGRGGLRRAGSFLPRRPGRARRAAGRFRHAGLFLDPAPDRGAARRRAHARPAGQRGHRRGQADGRRVRRQGEPGDHRRRHRRRARAGFRPAGEAPALARRRHDRHRQAARLPVPLRGRVRRRGPDRRARHPVRRAGRKTWPTSRPR